MRASLPMLLAGLIATDMDILRRKHRNDLIKNSFKEGKDILLTHAKVAILIRLASAAKFRISREDLLAMARHLNLRNKFDVSLGSITHQFSNVSLSVITAICTLAILLSIKSLTSPPILPEGLRSPGREVSQTRISIDADSPSRSISQMQMHLVHLEQSHRVHLLLQKLHASEMPRHIHMQASVWEPWFVCYSAALDGIISAESNQLGQSLLGVECAGFTSGFDGHPFRSHLHDIGLGTGKILLTNLDLDHWLLVKCVATLCLGQFPRDRSQILGRSQICRNGNQHPRTTGPKCWSENQ